MSSAKLEAVPQYIASSFAGNEGLNAASHGKTAGMYIKNYRPSIVHKILIFLEEHAYI